MNLTVQYINYWKDPFNDRWLLKFIKHHFPNKNVIEVKNKKSCNILIASINGPISSIKNINAKCKIFFYGENLNRECYRQYNNIDKLQKYFDLIVGFLPTNLEKRIIRFPLWFMYYKFYEMNDTEDNIIDYIRNEREKNKKRKKPIFGSCITRHSRLGIRKAICDQIEKYGRIAYPGKFRKNCSIGPKQVDKVNFLKMVKYNICPENSKFPGYHTEKIFHALEAGTVPIYWAIDLPEKDIINPGCYQFVNVLNKGLMVKQIKYAVENYDKMQDQQVFRENAKEIVKEYYTVLINQIKKYLS